MPSATQKRKLSHIKVTLKKPVESHVSSGFEDVHLIHKALPEIDRAAVGLGIELLGQKMDAPIIIESMTGGTPLAAKLNSVLAEAAEEFGLAMGVGSQRAAIENPELTYTYEVVRKRAPSIPLFANIGCPQLRGADGVKKAAKAVEMIDADALYVHLNALQECIQFEGETDFSGSLGCIQGLVKELGVPVFVKETGAGLSKEVAIALEGAGISGISVSGVGGTSWAAVESHRAAQRKDILHQEMGKTFWDWGIPTCASIAEVANSCNLVVIASGGMRDGLQIAKAIALGARAIGLARPFLESAARGREILRSRIRQLTEELRTAAFLTGSKDMGQLGRAPLVITGRTMEWLQQRGFDTSKYARR